MLSNEPFLWRRSREHACLLLHGLGGGIYELQWLAERLLAAGLTVQGFNYPGYDRPAHRMPPSRWTEWYGRALEHYLALQQEYPRVSLVGFSTGCLLALHLAFAHPVHKLVLLAPFFAIRHRWYYLFRLEQYLNSLGWLLDDVPRFRLPIRDGNVRALAEKVAYFRSFNLTAVRSALELIEQVKGEVASIQVPTLILQPRQDTVVDPDQAVWLYRELGSAEKSLQWLERSDHVLTLDCERETVFAQVCAFLTQDPAPAALG
ncbi:alpha/beta hydrolase [Synechococcus sp. F70.1]|uniref:alpha/beta hydrolase n=1 Tax=Synechococcus sp. F70.1 TaxID=2964532 RepID=UPI0039C73E2D